MSYEVFMVLGATVDDSGKRQEDIVVRFLEIMWQCSTMVREMYG